MRSWLSTPRPLPRPRPRPREDGAEDEGGAAVAEAFDVAFAEAFDVAFAEAFGVTVAGTSRAQTH
jgi:hypothetical protein